MTMTALDPEIWAGMNRFLDHYIGVHPEDHCVLAYAPDSRDQAILVTAGLKARDINPATVLMRPLVDDEFAGRLDAALPPITAFEGRLVVITLERDTMSHFAPLTEVLDSFGDKSRIIRIISSSYEFFTEAVSVLPDELSRRNATLLSKLDGAHSLHITTRNGTDLRVELDSQRFDWISNRGVLRAGGFMVLPAGEIATYPAMVNGVLVADGAINCNIISRLDMRMAEHPVTVEIRDSEATDFVCSDPDIAELVSLSFGREHGRRVGELGFGTNDGISRFIPHNSHINERRVGVHLGFGQHNQSGGRVGYIADIHMDLITDGAQVLIEDTGETIDLSTFEVIDMKHPSMYRDEDVVADCCGRSYGQLLRDYRLSGQASDV